MDFKCFSFGVILLLIVNFCFGQDSALVSSSQIKMYDTDGSILKEIENQISIADLSANNEIISPVGFNVFIQKRVINYLTGVSDLSLSKFYATYGSDKSKLDLGFNIPVYFNSNRQLFLVVNPIFQANMKSEFSTLYSDGKWKNDIKGGLKLTYLIGKSSLTPEKNESKNNLKVFRTKKYNEIKKQFEKEYSEKEEKVALISNKVDEKSYVIKDLNKKELKYKRNKTLDDFGKDEAEFLIKEKGYSKFNTFWFSFWVLFPLSEADNYISPNNTQLFEKIKFSLWDVNFQFTWLHEKRRIGTFYFTPWIKVFQNNSAYADLMKKVDYVQYSQFPNSNTQNLALLDNNKAFIGDFDEFITTNINFQFVYMTPLEKKLIKPGFSFRFEKNWGEFSPTNLRFGLPISIQGKEKPVNIELQYRINDVGNYLGVDDHETSKIFGISLGLPIVLLY